MAAVRCACSSPGLDTIRPYTMFAGRGEDLKVGIADNLLRLSVGLEDAQDILSDIFNALSIAL